MLPLTQNIFQKYPPQYKWAFSISFIRTKRYKRVTVTEGYRSKAAWG